jgi:O-antigen/teichoic acid export membrane protein
MSFAWLPDSPVVRRLARGAGWSLAGGIASRAFTVLSAVLVARIVGREGFGAFGMVQSTIGMFGVLAGFGLGSTATKYVAEYRAKDPARAGSISSLTIGASMASGGLLSLACLLAAPWLAGTTLHDPGMTDLLRAGAPLLFFSAMNGVLLGVLAGFEAFRAIARISLIQGALAPVAAVPLSWGYGVDGMVAAATVNAAVGCLLCAATLRGEYARWGIPSEAVREPLRDWRILWHYSLPAMTSGLLVAPVTWATNLLLIGRPGGVGELGLFNAANQWRTFILFLPGMLAAAILPILSEAHGNDNRTDFVRAMSLNFRATWVVCLPLTMLVIVMGRPLSALFGREFAGAASLVAPLMASCFLAVVNNAAASALAGAGRMWAGAALNGLWAVVLLGCARLLVPSGGATGLALSYLAAYALHTLWVMLYVERKLAPTLVRSRWRLVLGSAALLGLGTHAALAGIGSILYGMSLVALSVLPALAWIREGLTRGGAPGNDESNGDEP